MKEFEIIDYLPQYEDEVNNIEKSQWGVWSERGIAEKIEQGSIVKLGKCNNEVVGVSYYRQIGDLLHYQAIVIKPEFQRYGLGTMFAEEAAIFAKNNNIKNIFCEAIIANGKMNAERLLSKFGFVEILRVNNYWGSLYPDVLCAECGCKPCKCDCAFFVKKL